MTGLPNLLPGKAQQCGTGKGSEEQQLSPRRETNRLARKKQFRGWEQKAIPGASRQHKKRESLQLARTTWSAQKLLNHV